MTTRRISAEDWNKIVFETTGVEPFRFADNSYVLYPMESTLPRWFLKRRPYITELDDCDDRSKYGYCEIHSRRKGVPITLVSGEVEGFGYHEFLLVGCLDPSTNKLTACFCHRLEKEFEWISFKNVLSVDGVW